MSYNVWPLNPDFVIREDKTKPDFKYFGQLTEDDIRVLTENGWEISTVTSFDDPLYFEFKPCNAH